MANRRLSAAFAAAQLLISISCFTHQTHAFLTPNLTPSLPIPMESSLSRSITSQTSRFNHAGAATKLFMSTTNAMDLLSDSCVKALSFSQEASRNLELTTLDNELFLVGMIRTAGAEDMEVRKILTSFGISPDGAMQSAQEVLFEKGLISMIKPGSAGMGGDSGLGDSSPLPFSAATKQTLDDAISIAERMSPGSDGIVLPGHVLLALLEFDERYSVATEDVKCAGLAVLKKTAQNSPVARVFDGTQFCRDLADEMIIKAQKAASAGGVTEITQREVVVVDGKRVGGNTPTLDKIGVDLTEMARGGRLDAVFGRDDEIRMCLRTLGRRRKSNPCLIGEPGVGKTAIAEGIAQPRTAHVFEGCARDIAGVSFGGIGYGGVDCRC
mmetsp:Transcript_17821/g.32208  ORF Transcript_17821/g.32208 Transcript_17821/m.32208 type:complete len:383 (+) Transcript_17821:179-1327(+)